MRFVGKSMLVTLATLTATNKNMSDDSTLGDCHVCDVLM
jgi:hypothetical protein